MREPQPVMIELNAVSKRYGSARTGFVQALERVSLVCTRGATLAIVGESASGKSTILRVLTGLVQADEGTAFVGGIEIAPNVLPTVRLHIGYVIQEGGLFPHLTARENVELMARHTKRDIAWIRTRTDELLTMVRLTAETLERRPAELSGGQRQRVALMRALMLEPPVLLLDEPFSALDPLIRRDLQRDLRRITTNLGTTTLLVTHDLREADICADSVAIMQHGRILQHASLDTLRTAPATEFVHEFVEAAGMTRI
jgi:osmoprotectant transport system ATP-binding protein